RNARLRQSALQVGQVALDDRGYKGVDDGGGGALVLPVLRVDLVRERDRYTGQHLADDGRGLPLVLRVQVGVKEADGDRLHPLLAERRGRVTHAVRVERHDRDSVDVDTLAHLLTQVARDE